MKKYTVYINSGFYELEADEMVLNGDFVEFIKDGKTIAIFYRPVYAQEHD